MGEKELGKACANRMKREWNSKNIIAVTGGSTMAEVADSLSPDEASKKLTFVPARGELVKQCRIRPIRLSKNGT